MRRRSSKPAARGAQRPSRAGASSGWPWLQTPPESPAAASVGAVSHTEGDGLSPCLTIRGLAALLGLSERTIRTRLRERPHELPPTIRLNSWSLRFINVGAWLKARTKEARVTGNSREDSDRRRIHDAREG